MLNTNDRARLAEDVMAHAKVTRCSDWNRVDDEGSLDPSKMARPIPPIRWGKALKMALDIDDTLAMRNLPRPTVGADPEGFVWLTWERGERRFSLGLTSSAFRWEKHTDETRIARESRTLGDAIDALGSTFPWSAR